MNNFLITLLTRHRGLIIFLIAVPASFIVNRLQKIQGLFFQVFLASNKLHDKYVAQIQLHVKKAHENKQKMCTARKPWKTMSLRVATFKNNCAQIPIHLKNILNMDVSRQIIRVEPMVTMEEITRFLIPKGYALAVQVEMDDLTIGGLCMGVGIETSSHRHGFLFETIESFEIILGNGSKQLVTREQHADLFHALPWSHGTLGFLTAVELKIVPIKPFIKLDYIPCYSEQDFIEQFTLLANATHPPAYLEALVFSDQQSVILCGELADDDNLTPVNKINRWYKKWFYSHAETCLQKGRRSELIPIRDYFHRHTPSVFFQLKELIPFANQAWYRYLFAWLGAPKISLMKFTYTKTLRKQAMFNRVTQDVVVPLTKVSCILQFAYEKFGIYPIWICPVKLFSHDNEGFLRNPTNESEMYVDVGVYGIPKAVSTAQPWDMTSVSRQLESLSLQLGGYHFLYADIFMTHAEFRKMFNHELYDSMRQKYYAEAAFPTVYEKVIPEAWLFDADEI